MNSASVHCSQLTWSNSAAGTKKKKKEQNVDTQRRIQSGTKWQEVDLKNGKEKKKKKKERKKKKIYLKTILKKL